MSHINIPNFEGLTIEAMIDYAKDSKQVMDYLPINLEIKKTFKIIYCKCHSYCHRQAFWRMGRWKNGRKKFQNEKGKKYDDWNGCWGSIDIQGVNSSIR